MLNFSLVFFRIDQTCMSALNSFRVNFCLAIEKIEGWMGEKMEEHEGARKFNLFPQFYF